MAVYRISGVVHFDFVWNSKTPPKNNVSETASVSFFRLREIDAYSMSEPSYLEF
jgi:hypothetical protein